MNSLSPEFEIMVERLAGRIAERVCERLIAHQEVAGGDRSPWMGIEKAADYLDWPRQRLYKLTASGEIPHYKHEGRLLFRTDELDRWLAQFAEGGLNPERRSENRAIVAFDGNKSSMT